MKIHTRFCQAYIVLVLSVLTAPARGSFEPWEPLVDDSWIYFGPPQTRLLMHTVNGGDYEVGFDQRRSDDSARGLRALRFSYGGGDTGHLVSASLTGSFDIVNTGDNRTFSDLLLLTAIDAPELPPDFAMSLGLHGTVLYDFNRLTDFGYYDYPGYDTGRPTGYHSLTSPTGEGISYAFETGMVSVFAIQDAGLGPLGGTATIDYEFENLPGTAVFSVYGYDSNLGWIFHTNRGLIDNNRAGDAVSTFEVVPEPSVLSFVGLGVFALARRRPARRARP